MLIFSKETTVYYFLYSACICPWKAVIGFSVHRKSVLFSLPKLSPVSYVFMPDSWTVEYAAGFNIHQMRWVNQIPLDWGNIWNKRVYINDCTKSFILTLSSPLGEKQDLETGLEVEHSYASIVDYCNLAVFCALRIDLPWAWGGDCLPVKST